MQKYDGKASPRLICKKSKLSMSLDQQSEVLYGLYLLYGPLENYQNKLKGRYFHIKDFQKTKRGLQLVSLPHFHCGF